MAIKEILLKALIQHFIYCEYLLQHLESIGPFTFKMTNGIKKLRREVDIIQELLNMASEPYLPINIEEVLPALSSNDHLISFWNSITTQEDMLSVTCEEFAIALDKQFGAKLWSECPDLANKVYSTLSWMLGLEGEVGDPSDFKMCVTVFHYSTYFIKEGGGILVKCLRALMDK
ncbi:rho family-interacting cell polarization regulator 2-like isoform X2 [Dysidea avara]|uniref:rho family-interacting cell polarization regulator 2-like isoform X2 n=1 Tax=Dysidea avara TaxID=196820 RepID=UPI00331ED09E